MRQCYVYILATELNGTLYTGVTRDLLCRVAEHREKLDKNSFSGKYSVSRLVYFEVHEDIYEVITREKQIKNWKREWKINLIEEDNPQWLDLYIEIT